MLFLFVLYPNIDLELFSPWQDISPNIRVENSIYALVLVVKLIYRNNADKNYRDISLAQNFYVDKVIRINIALTRIFCDIDFYIDEMINGNPVIVS